MNSTTIFTQAFTQAAYSEITCTPGGREGSVSGQASSIPSSMARPYAMTRARTRPRYQLAIEALVSTTADTERLRGLSPEHQQVCRLCRQISSVAEISALLAIPLGIVRLLVADLAEAGLVAVNQPDISEAGDGPDVAVLERVLGGLRRVPDVANRSPGPTVLP